MKTYAFRPVIAICLASTLLVPAAVAQQGSGPQPPLATKKLNEMKIHGLELKDDYFLLREKANPDVIKHFEAENAYTDAIMQPTRELQKRLYEEMLGRIKETDTNVPYRKDGYWYYTRTEQGKNYPIFCRKKGNLDAPEEVVLDQNALAEGKKFHALGGVDVSPDGSKLLYLEDLTAFREYTLHVKDLATGRIIDSIPNVWNGTAWADDNKTFFYMTADAAKRVAQDVRGSGGTFGFPELSAVAALKDQIVGQ